METITNGVHMVSRGVNAFIVDGDQGVTLVDTGLPRRQGAITDALSNLGRSPSDIAAIVLTHAHADHFGGAAALRTESGASVYASRVDAPAIQGEAPTPPPPVLQRLRFLQPVFRLFPDADPVTVDQTVSEGQNGELPADLTVINTPGHTPGHVSYLLDRAGGILFVGDAALAAKDGAVRRGWMNRAEPAFDASLRHIAEHRFEVACFGHSRPLTSHAAGAFRRFVEQLSGTG